MARQTVLGWLDEEQRSHPNALRSYEVAGETKAREDDDIHVKMLDDPETRSRGDDAETFVRGEGPETAIREDE